MQLPVIDQLDMIRNNFCIGMTAYTISWDNPQDLLEFVIEQIDISIVSNDYCAICFHLTHNNPIYNETYKLEDFNNYFFTDIALANKKKIQLCGGVV